MAVGMRGAADDVAEPPEDVECEVEGDAGGRTRPEDVEVDVAEGGEEDG